MGERFTNVLIENRDALDVMAAHDAPTTLFYVDPPYVLSTRQMQGAGRYYRHEMDDKQHLGLTNSIAWMAWWCSLGTTHPSTVIA